MSIVHLLRVKVDPLEAETAGASGNLNAPQTMSTAQGGDKSMAELLSNAADIGLLGPEAPIYVLVSDSPTKRRIFCGLTVTAGFMLLNREKVDKFELERAQGRDIFGFRAGITPLLFLSSPSGDASVRNSSIDCGSAPRLELRDVNMRHFNRGRPKPLKACRGIP